ncbi:MAG: PASTA domain-containing protein [Firmicutes bacterium]|jgi:stage V sporulation protein D (sporulation-specific penicillin-binding protein)|nr:PASTA domain-containing protein [Bacillota bacterium]
MKKRVGSLFLMWAAVTLFLIGRLFWVQVARNEHYRKLALDQRLYPVPVDARRGTIRDVKGRELAVSVSADAVYAIPADIDDPPETAKQVSKILGLDVEAVRKKLSEPLATVWIDRRVDPEKAAALRKLNLKGIGFAERGQRFYPKDNLAAHVLGIVGIDNQGLEGIEVQYDYFLQGTKGQVRSERDATGKEIPGGITQFIPPVDGNDLYLTIDEVIQYIVERELDKGMAELKAKRGMILAMDPMTGAVLAMASRPAYNPNRYFEEPDSLRRNPIVSDTYEPGSTFKIITAAAALEERIVRPDDTFFDPGFIKVADRYVRCWLAGGHGTQTFTEATENSCNVVFATLGTRLGQERFYRYIQAFGLGSPLGIDYPGEAAGLLQRPKNVGPVELANISFGQGISVTPLQLLSALSAIANGGTLMRPHLVSKIVDPDGLIVKDFREDPIRQVISKETSKELSLILESVIVNGSGFRAKVPGYRVAGKTGTAEKPGAGGYSDKRVASFLGFAPVEDPKIAILVVWDEPDVGISYGGVLAAPAFQSIVKDVLRYMEIPPSVPAETEERDSESRQVIVPNLISRNPDEAARLLAAEFGLNVATRGTGVKIVHQAPAAGAKVQRGATVILYLDEPESYNVEGEVIVPNVIGRTMKDVAVILSDLGLRMEAEGTGVAKSSVPQHGTSVKIGTVVQVRFEPLSVNH